MSNIAESKPLEITKETVKNYICKEATDLELTFFVELCKRQNLNPFIKEAYLVKYGSQANVIVAKDVFLKRAIRNADYKGFKAGVIVEGNGQIKEQEGAFLSTGQKLIGGWACVYKKQSDIPIKATVSMSEYSSSQSSWKKMPATMIRKVALVQAHREAYPDDFHQMYDESEIEAIKRNSSQPMRATSSLDSRKAMDSHYFDLNKVIIDGFSKETFIAEMKVLIESMSAVYDDASIQKIREYGKTVLDSHNREGES